MIIFEDEGPSRVVLLTFYDKLNKTLCFPTGTCKRSPEWRLHFFTADIFTLAILEKGQPYTLTIAITKAYCYATKSNQTSIPPILWLLAF